MSTGANPNSKNASSSKYRQFDDIMARKDQAYLDSFNSLPNTFLAVNVTQPSLEDSTMLETSFDYKITVKPVSGRLIKSGPDGAYEFKPSDDLVPTDSLPDITSVSNFVELDELIKFYGTLDYLRASSNEPISQGLEFGQIVECKFLKGDANNGDAGRLTFDLPRSAKPVFHQDYVDLISDLQTNSAKEPFTSNPAALLGTAQDLTSTDRPVDMSNSGKRLPAGEEMTTEDMKLFDVIAEEESRGNYNAWNRLWYPEPPNDRGFKIDAFNTSGNTEVTPFGLKLTSMTIGQLKQAGKVYVDADGKRKKRGEGRPTTKPNKSIFAAGKYQIVPPTLLGIIKRNPSKFTDDLIFDKNTQDAMMFDLIYGGKKRPTLTDYLSGGSATLDAAQNDLAYEFASIPKVSGEGAYANEKARGNAEKIRAALEAARKSHLPKG